jgi:hypothetical protein
MSPDQIFDTANATALAGWLVLLASPWAPRLADWVGGYAVPIVLAVGYTVLVVAAITAASPEAGGEGGAGVDFSSLDGVAALFAQREAVLVGWLHYLAFDLFVGGWEVRTARRERIRFLLVVPCLVLTLFAGPAGFLLFMVVRAARWGRRGATAVE